MPQVSSEEREREATGGCNNRCLFPWGFSLKRKRKIKYNQKRKWISEVDRWQCFWEALSLSECDLLQRWQFWTMGRLGRERKKQRAPARISSAYFWKVTVLQGETLLQSSLSGSNVILILIRVSSEFKTHLKVQNPASVKHVRVIL